MPSFGGTVLRSLATALYALEFCCAGIILGIYSYFLSVLADHNLPIKQNWKAVEGISGCGVLYTVFAVLLTCFLGGIAFFAFLGIALDVLFCLAFIALAVLTDDGASSCNGTVQTPLGTGPSNKNSAGYGKNGFGFNSGQNLTYEPSLGLACRLNSAAFAVSIIGAFLFLFSAILQVFVARHHRKEKKYGPSPANNYTSGSGRRNPFKRRQKNKDQNKDAEMASPMANGAGPTGTGVEHNIRPSHDTGYTGTTNQYSQQTYNGPNKLDHGGYHTGPVGTSVNPYGYDNTRNTASNF